LILEALILDFDGLIVDTESPIFETWRETYRAHGLELDLADWQHALGTHGGFDPCLELSTRLARELDCEGLRDEVRERNQRRCEAQPLLPGIAELVEEARRLGLRTAVASSSSRGWVESWLSHHDIGDRFDCVRARDDVLRVKPAPDLFLAAAVGLGVSPDRCLVFEDSPNGIRAAQAAGMRCVAIPNSVTRPLPLPDPDLVLESASAIPLVELARRLGFSLPAQ
jgi:HAD superfamily hydrolase (TIGR01509 family)